MHVYRYLHLKESRMQISNSTNRCTSQTLSQVVVSQWPDPNKNRNLSLGFAYQMSNFHKFTKLYADSGVRFGVNAFVIGYSSVCVRVQIVFQSFALHFNSMGCQLKSNFVNSGHWASDWCLDIFWKRSFIVFLLFIVVAVGDHPWCGTKGAGQLSLVANWHS